MKDIIACLIFGIGFFLIIGLLVLCLSPGSRNNQFMVACERSGGTFVWARDAAPLCLAPDAILIPWKGFKT